MDIESNIEAYGSPALIDSIQAAWKYWVLEYEGSSDALAAVFKDIRDNCHEIFHEEINFLIGVGLARRKITSVSQFQHALGQLGQLAPSLPGHSHALQGIQQALNYPIQGQNAAHSHAAAMQQAMHGMAVNQIPAYDTLLKEFENFQAGKVVPVDSIEALKNYAQSDVDLLRKLHEPSNSADAVSDPSPKHSPRRRDWNWKKLFD